MSIKVGKLRTWLNRFSEETELRLTKDGYLVGHTNKKGSHGINLRREHHNERPERPS